MLENNLSAPSALVILEQMTGLGAQRAPAVTDRSYRVIKGNHYDHCSVCLWPFLIGDMSVEPSDWLIHYKFVKSNGSAAFTGCICYNNCDTGTEK